MENLYNKAIEIAEAFCIEEGTYDNRSDLSEALINIINEVSKQQRIECANTAKEWWDHVSKTVSIMGECPPALYNDIKNHSKNVCDSNYKPIKE